ncbi:helix-turn-helix domain-containing protein [Vibrio agarivorans]|uniref:Helix-turn-helix domain-containing protein n=1 Tax=Vibrio agarivorans TaxID=153622 RepID=A0ABT7Y4A2_9VIBR|nr:helix-turn-helix domain-containing protein [Vibrio agarivorans]MDN2482871.1 helix-turn-helix domain-containing protein [Vibrio agarivorans]
MQSTQHLDSSALHADTLYQYLDNVNSILGEPYFGYDLGKTLYEQDYSTHAPKGGFLQNAIERCGMMAKLSNYATFHFDIINDRLIIRVERTQSIRQSTQIIDELIAGYLLCLLKETGEDYFKPNSILVTADSELCFPLGVVTVRSNDKEKSNHLSINIPLNWALRSNTVARFAEKKVQTTSLDTIRLHCRENLSNPQWGIDTLAEACNLSKRSLQRLLSQHNVTYTNIMNKERLITIKSALQSGACFEEIASISGFRNVSSLNRFFKAQTQCTLTAFLAK